MSESEDAWALYGDAEDEPWNRFVEEHVSSDEDVSPDQATRTVAASACAAIPKKMIRRSAPFSARRSRRRWGRIWLAAWLMVAGTLAGFGLFNRGHAPPAVPIVATLAASKPPAAVAIERVKVGDRVVAAGSSGELTGQTQVNPATWRLIELYAAVRYGDGTDDEIEIVTLQPPEWVAAHGAEVGAEVPAPLDLLEFGLPEDFRATVVANEPCPPVKPGPGRVVLTTISHNASDVYEVTIASPEGRAETVRSTGAHRFYRNNDAAWVSAHDLRHGDELQGAQGQIYVQNLAKIAGTHRVYNMTVEGEHVYRVSLLGALVHNNGACSLRALDPRRRLGYDPGEIHQDHPIARVFGGDPGITRPLEAGANLRKGGLEGNLQKYKNYLMRNGMEERLADQVIQSEIQSLARDVIASPFSNVFPPGFSLENLGQ
jgi:hypothetical protein